MQVLRTQVSRTIQVATFGFALLVSSILMAQETPDYFKTSCASCHTIGGGPLTGPDLKDVESRKDRDWLIRFMMDPAPFLASDPYAKKLLAESNNIPMPKVAGLDRDRARRILDLIKDESALEKSQFSGVALDDRPFTAADVAIGRELFNGNRALANGAPSCASCHTISGQTGLGGGSLGPDLTDAYARMNGRKSLGAWLRSPATATMAPVFKTAQIADEEILPLLAYMKHETETGESAPGLGVEFLVFGIVGAVLVLVLCDVVWRTRFKSVRSRIVKGQS